MKGNIEENLNQVALPYQVTGGSGDTCYEIGCGIYDSSNPCFCDMACVEYGDCCQDYDEVCGEDGTGSAPSNLVPYENYGYADYPSNQTGFTVFAQINSIYVPKTGTYKIKIHYASDEDKILRIVSRKPNTDPLLEPIQTGLVSQQLFPSTGGLGSWDTIEILVDFEAGESNDLRI